VDLLYHESTFLHDRLERAKETFHSTAKQAGCIARLAKAQKLMLGHYSARYRELDELLEEAQHEHPQVILGKEGLCVGIESNIEELLASK
jgi:ribonuclease Z